MFRLTSAISFLILGIGFIVQLRGQNNQLDAMKVLEELAARCGTATSYQFRAHIQFADHSFSRWTRMLTDAEVEFAVSQPGKQRLLLENKEKEEYQRFSDGNTTWVYVPELKCYTEHDDASTAALQNEVAGQSDDERDVAETYAHRVIPILAGLLEEAESAEVIGISEVDHGGQKHHWPVLSVKSKPVPGQGETTTKLTLDGETLDIAKIEREIVTSNQGRKRHYIITIDFHELRIGERLPDSAFVFNPPRSAKRVQQVPIPGQTGSYLLNRPAPNFELKNTGRG